jgi:hypothetical protein
MFSSFRGINKLAAPGDIVTCRPGEDRLYLWSSMNCNPDEINGQTEPGEILLVLDVRKNIETIRNLQDEWSNGAYFLYSSRGISGWVGAGWVVPVTT